MVVAAAAASTPFSLSSAVFTRRRSFRVSATLSREPSPLLRAAQHTVDSYVESGMVVGLGSGEASDLAIRYLGHQLRSGSIQGVVGVPMSARSASEAAKYGVPLKHFRDDFQIDFAFHDADAVEEGTLVSVIGRRTSTTQEDDYILLQKATDEAVFLIKDEQYKSGLEGSIPVLVQSLNWLAVAEEIDDLYLGDAEVWRRASVGDAGPLGGDFPIVTSDGHNILDVIFTTPIPSLANVAKSLDNIDGVVDHGLVMKNRCTVVIAGETEVRTVTLQTSAVEGGV
ncbi:probable ribose-5-phosphate isomerase 4, chloroplastic isoform X2 [Brassica napus]|uniref:probable ribose-5-phosphate isomerase 4, chloroplastic isoform X2 n=1 Tax=Brassica oleracea var. oleracea TaxID=109376 RepID=UPI0006A70FE1|nr:PREDICTED: probable ribose-5-phosphate isomerase 4, chloroplastic isoform X2 [Brassica oleracea var. oleracea]XP_013675676.2 probable ribose-5-phosphate isomerase 4, chloroplastic isoform X2 [Brassica napus]